MPFLPPNEQRQSAEGTLRSCNTLTKSSLQEQFTEIVGYEIDLRRYLREKAVN